MIKRKEKIQSLFVLILDLKYFNKESVLNIHYFVIEKIVV